MRITVSLILGQVAHGATFAEILEAYPDLDLEDLKQTIDFAGDQLPPYSRQLSS
jgi:uncharacterized protein (DUF433 family)